MSLTQTQKEVRTNKRAAEAPQRKALVEKAKTILIVIAIAASLGFGFGDHYASNRTAQVQQAVSSAIRTQGK